MAELIMEELKALYFDKDALIEPDYKLYRVNIGDARYYYTLENEKIKYMPGVTTIIQFTSSMSPYLLDWYINLGKQKAKEMMKELALYGTLMHKAKAEYTIGKFFDLNKESIIEYINDFIEREKIDFDTADWQKKLQNDIMAWHYFCIEHRFRPLAVEIGLKNKKNQWGGTIDDVGYMVIGNGRNGLIRKGEKAKEIIAVMDAKSGRHPFYEGHEIQVEGFYRPMWNENYPNLKAERSFNWAPKNLEDVALDNEGSKYYLKDQTDMTGARIIEANCHYNKYMIRNFKIPGKIILFQGKLEWGKENKEQIKSINLETYLLNGGEYEPEIISGMGSENNIDELF